MEPKKKPVLPLAQKIRAADKKMARTHARLMRTRQRKERRRPSQWGPDELSNPDLEYLAWLKDMAEVFHRDPNLSEKRRVATYLKPSKRMDRPQLLRRHERKKMRELIGEVMRQEGYVPRGQRLRTMYKSIKGKSKKELWK